MSANEYCKNCTWYGRGGWCNKHEEYKKDFDTCNNFTRTSGRTDLANAHHGTTARALHDVAVESERHISH